MRATRLRSLVAVAAVAAATLAMSDPVVTPDAPEDCWLFRGADTVDDTSDDQQVCRQDVWFSDPGTKVGNAGTATGFASWDTTPPDTSVTGGAGGGAAGVSASHQLNEAWDERFSMVAEGAHEGAFDTLAVELYLFPPAGMAQSQTTFAVDAQLLVDGAEVASIGGMAVPMETAGDAVRRIRFAWTGLADVIEDWDLVLDGTHDVRLTVHGTGIASNAAVFVYDTTEVPAGMVFNIDPADLGDIPVVEAF